MLVTLAGISILVRLIKSVKAFLLIEVTPDGTTISVALPL